MHVQLTQKDIDSLNSKLGCSEGPQLEVQQAPEYADTPAWASEEPAASLGRVDIFSGVKTRKME